MVVETTCIFANQPMASQLSAVRARPHEPVRPATHDTVHQGGMDRPPPTGGRSETYPTGGRSETYTSNLPPRRTSLAPSSRSRQRSKTPSRQRSPNAETLSTRSRVAVYRVQAAARGPLDAFSPRHSSHPTMTIMLTPAAKASTSATVCLSDVLFCSRAGSTSTVAT